MFGDWIKLHRRAIAHPVFSDESLWRLFSWCLIKANFRDGAFMGKRIARGSFATGRHAAAEELNEKPSTVYKRWQRLVELGCISMESNNHFTIITICNYGAYQSFDEEDSDILNNQVTTREQPGNNQVTTREQPGNTIEEEQECKKERMEEERGSLSLSEKLRKVVPERYLTPEVLSGLAGWAAVYPSRHNGSALDAITLATTLKRQSDAGWDASKLARSIELSIAVNAKNLCDPDSHRGGNGRAKEPPKSAYEIYGVLPLPEKAKK